MDRYPTTKNRHSSDAGKNPEKFWTRVRGGKATVAGVALVGSGLLGVGYATIDTTPKAAHSVEADSAPGESLYTTAAEQAAKNSSSLEAGDIPEALETALRDYQKMWDHDTKPTEKSTSRLVLVGEGMDITIAPGDELNKVTMAAYLQRHPEKTDVSQVPQSVVNSLVALNRVYEDENGRVQPGDKLTLHEVIDPRDHEHTTPWVVLTDQVSQNRD